MAYLSYIKGFINYGTVNRSRENLKNEEKNYPKNSSDNDHNLSLDILRSFSQHILGFGLNGTWHFLGQKF